MLWRIVAVVVVVVVVAVYCGVFDIYERRTGEWFIDS
jgi:hypothetical protein